MFSPTDIASGGAQLLGGIFGNSGAPYEDAMSKYKKYFGQAREAQNPFYNAGTNAIGGFQDWLGTMKNPSDFINHLMNSYQESPWARFQKLQAERAAQNMGSATGLTGSTPLMLQSQQNASNISSQDMNQWLQNVLGINNQYGAGLNSLIGTGSGAANSISTLMSQLAELMGTGAAGAKAGQLQDRGDVIGGLLKMFTG